MSDKPQYMTEREQHNKEKILSCMDKLARRGIYWNTANAIAREEKMSHLACRSLLYKLVVDGFLIVRDGDTDNQKMLFAIKPSLRTKKGRKINEPA